MAVSASADLCHTLSRKLRRYIEIPAPLQGTRYHFVKGFLEGVSFTLTILTEMEGLMEKNILTLLVWVCLTFD